MACGGVKRKEKCFLLHRVGVGWCKLGRIMMKDKRGKGKKRMEGKSASRASVSFPPDLYETLEKLARHKKVSLAWVVRDAAEKYVADEWPLFGKAERGEGQ